MIDGYSPPFRYGMNRFGGGDLIYIRDDIPGKDWMDKIFLKILKEYLSKWT